MSWSASFEHVENDLPEIPDHEIGLTTSHINTVNQYNAARRIACELIASGLVGYAPFRVVLAGHANTDNNTEYTASIHVSVSQSSIPKAD